MVPGVFVVHLTAGADPFQYLTDRHILCGARHPPALREEKPWKIRTPNSAPAQ